MRTGFYEVVGTRKRLKLTQEWLGYVDIRITQRYTLVNKVDLANARSSLDNFPVNNKDVSEPQDGEKIKR